MSSVSTREIQDATGHNALVASKGDMQDWLCAADVLMTDYSSTMFDFAVTGRPCLLYVFDAKVYQESRGMYLALNELPFLCVPEEDIAGTICSFSPEKYRENVTNFLHKIGNVEDGAATKRVVKLIEYTIQSRHGGDILPTKVSI